MKILPVPLLLIALAFVLFTVAGTVTHEIGHVVVAEGLGYETELHYGSMSWEPAGVTPPLDHNLWVQMGGPVQTMLTGTLAFTLLVWRRKKKIKYTGTDWLLVFCSLFWLRQPANLAAWFVLDPSYSSNGDEMIISTFFNWPELSLLSISAVLGTAIAVCTIFFLLPRKYVFTFLFGGLIGGSAGYWLWLYKAGPLLLP